MFDWQNTIRIGPSLTLCFFISVAGNAQQQAVSAERAYAMTAPAVVMVQTVLSATVYVNRVQMNTGQFDQLVDSVRRLDTSGTLLTPEDKIDIVVRALYRSPLRYLSRTAEYLSQQHRIVSSGTGFFVTGDGYLLTNAHILDRDSAYIKQKFMLSTYQDVTNDNIRSLESSWETKLNDQQRVLLTNAYGAIYSQVSSMILDNLKQELFVLLRVDGKEREEAIRMPATVVIKGRSMPGKDVAILKVDKVKEMPVVPLSTDSIARIGEQVWVYGYPEPVLNNQFLARDNGTDPSLTQGIVSAVKRSIGGWPVIQTDAAITHGSSGSPVCNSSGLVTGLATFGSVEQGSGKLSSAYNFAIPMSVVREFLDSARIEPAMSHASATFNTALGFYFDGFYSRALQEFHKVENFNPDYPTLRSYQRSSQAKIDAGLDEESFFQRAVFRVMALIIIVGGVFVFFRMQRAASRARRLR